MRARARSRVGFFSDLPHQRGGERKLTDSSSIKLLVAHLLFRAVGAQGGGECELGPAKMPVDPIATVNFKFPTANPEVPTPQTP